MARIDDIRRFFDVVHRHTPPGAWVAFSQGGNASWKTIFAKKGAESTVLDKIATTNDLNMFMRLTPMRVKPAGGRGIESDSWGASVLHCDIDAYNPLAQEEALATLEQMETPPTLTVFTGNGLSAFWQLNEFVTDIAAIKARNKGLATLLGAHGGDSCYDAARVMRIPGTWNLKFEPRLAHILSDRPERMYSLNQFAPAILDDSDLALEDAQPEQLPENFATHVKEKRPKLWERIEDAGGAPRSAQTNDTDFSRNDWNIACQLLGMGYSIGVVLSVLMHPEWASGEKYRRSRSVLYVLRTASAASRHVAGSTPGKEGSSKPLIYVPPGTYDVEEIVNRTFDLFQQLAAAKTLPLFQSVSGELIELWREPSFGRLIARPLNRHSLRRIVQTHIGWFTTTAKNERRPTTPPDKVLDTMLARPNDSIPVIYKVVHVPTFVRGADGLPKLLETPGYDEASKVYYDPSVVIDETPLVPTQAEVAAATTVLSEVFCDFPFADDASRAHAISLALLPFVRELVDGSTPFHLVDAPIQGSGKGLCVQAALSIYFGSGLHHTSEAADDGEWRKRLFAFAREGVGYLWIDNITKGMNWSPIAAALTSGHISDRVLGQSLTMSVPVRFVWCGTANNAVIGDDLLRRVAYIRLSWTSRDIADPKDLQPQAFTHYPLLQWVQANRPKLIHACLTICRAGLRASNVVANKNSFESWSAIIGNILAVMGVTGFLANDTELRELTQDDSVDRTVDIFEAAVKFFGWNTAFTARQLAEKLTGPEGVMYIPDGIRNPPKFVGILLSQCRDKVISGKYVVRRGGSPRNGYTWTLVAFGGNHASD